MDRLTIPHTNRGQALSRSPVLIAGGTGLSRPGVLRNMKVMPSKPRGCWRRAIGRPRRAVACLVARLAVSMGAASTMSFARAAQYPRKWFDAYEGVVREHPVAPPLAMNTQTVDRHFTPT